MKDILLRFNLQTYDGASNISNIMRKKSGVATKLLVEQPKVLVTAAKVTLSVWLLKILLHVVKYYETLWRLWGKFVLSLSIHQRGKIF